MLRAPTDLPERADLAHELVRAASRYRDVMGRVVAPSVDGSRTAPFLLADDSDQSELVAAMEGVLKRTKHLDPRNAHTGDPQGLEDAIAVMESGLRQRLELEDQVLPRLVQGLSPQARAELRRETAHALPSASQHPHLARTKVGRAIRNLGIKLDHAFEDVATPSHPGERTVHQGEPAPDGANGGGEKADSHGASIDATRRGVPSRTPRENFWGPSTRH